MLTATRNDIIAPFRPLTWQRDPLMDKSPIVLVTGSAGGGKSRLMAEKLHAYCKHYDGAMALMLRKTRNSMTNSTVLFVERTIVGPDPSVIHFPSKNRFEYANGSILAYGGMANEDQKQQVRSIGHDGSLDIVWMEEANAFTEADFEELTARMRGKAADWRQVGLSTNPDSARHWINQRLIKGKEARAYYSEAADNTYNPADYQESLNRLTGIMRDRLRDGLWVQAQGAVYDMFDYRVHVVDREPGECKRFYLAMDEGYTNPAVILLVGEDADGRLHIFEEFYKSGVLQKKVVERAGQYIAPYKEVKTFDGAIVDAAAAGLVADLQDAGIYAIGHKGRVFDGITKMQARLRVQEDGKPRLTVAPACTNTIGEFEAYQWKPEKDEPVKENDHAMDAARYLVDYIDEGHNSGIWL
jgi:phage terminase large subunit